MTLSVVEANAPARALYRRLGFAETGLRETLPDGRVELQMAMDLVGRPTQRLYLDDLTVGQTFESRTEPVSREEIVAFASRFDPQPFHLTDEAGDASVFGGLAASGWHTGAMSMRLLVESVPLGDALVGLGVELAWPTPVHPGDVLRLVTTVTDVRVSRSKPDRGVVTIESLTLNQDDEVCQKMTGKVLVTRAPQ